LVQRVKARDPEGWQRLLDLYGPVVYRWCRSAGLRPEDAADVLQEVFRAVAEAVFRFHRDQPGDTFRGWLRVVTRNKIRDHFRRSCVEPAAIGGTVAQERLLQIADDATGSHASLPLWSDLARRALDVIQSEFEQRTWQAFWLTAIEERSADEVARQFGITPGAVRQAKYRILRRLRAELGDVD
jgi:RNA polymerase sigma-70 factor (ECF subfamily)